MRKLKVNRLFQIAVEEGSFDVYLITFEVVVIYQREEYPNGVFMSDTSIQFVIVNAGDLRESLCDPSSLVSCGLVCFPVDLPNENPFCL